MNASDVMAFNVITVAPTASVQEVATLLLNHHISSLPVVDGEGSLVGIISEGDLVRAPSLVRIIVVPGGWISLPAGRTRGWHSNM
jgi:CBS domain-containing protein